jgi:sRNA-binding carbon storage regulator CsrA
MLCLTRKVGDKTYLIDRTTGERVIFMADSFNAVKQVLSCSLHADSGVKDLAVKLGERENVSLFGQRFTVMLQKIDTGYVNEQYHLGFDADESVKIERDNMKKGGER